MVDDLVAVQTCGIPSLEMNEYINSKIEQKTLTLNETKCHKVLVRSSDKFCNCLKAHENDMTTRVSISLTDLTESVKSPKKMAMNVREKVIILSCNVLNQSNII